MNPATIASSLGSALGKGASVVGPVAGALTTQIIADQISDRLFTPVIPGAAASAAPAGKGFLTTSSEQLAIYQWVAGENQRRRQLNFLNQFIPGAEMLPELNPDSVIQQYSAVKEQELGGATQRKIQEIEATRGFDVQIAEIARQAEIEKQRLASEAEVAAQRERSLGDVQRQRVESSYTAASNLLDQAIKNVVSRERYENNTTLAELARAI